MSFEELVNVFHWKGGRANYYQRQPVIIKWATDDAGFAAPTRFGLRGHTFKNHQQRRKTRRRQHAFSVQIVPYWNKPPEEIVNDSFNMGLDARWQSPFSKVPLLHVPRYPLPNLFYPYDITVVNLGRL